MKKRLLLLFSFAILQTACQNGKYIGPSVGFSAGYEGVSAGFTLYGENPTTSGKTGLTNSPIQVTSGTNSSL